MDLHRTFNLNSNATDSSHSRIISNERKIIQQLGLIRMSLVSIRLPGVVIALLHALRNNRPVLTTSHNNDSTTQNESKWKFQWRKPRTVASSQYKLRDEPELRCWPVVTPDMANKFSIGFTFGKFLGQSNIGIFLSVMQFFKFSPFSMYDRGKILLKQCFSK